MNGTLWIVLTVPPAEGGGSPAPIDREILEYLRERLETTAQVADATITDEEGHLGLRVRLSDAYYPSEVGVATLLVRRYTNDDCSTHDREARGDDAWECRWDRHPNAHNSRDHYHPPPIPGHPTFFSICGTTRISIAAMPNANS